MLIDKRRFKAGQGARDLLQFHSKYFIQIGIIK